MLERAPFQPIVIRLLGAPSIATPTASISATKPFVFAAALYLGLNRGRAVRRDELAILLWPDASEAKQSERMRWLVRQLKLAGLDLLRGAPEFSFAKAHVSRDTDALATSPSASDTLEMIRADVLAGYEPRISDGFARLLAAYAHLAWLEQDDATLGALLPKLLTCFTETYRFMDHPALVTARALERFEGWSAASAFVRRFVTEIRDEQWTPRAELRAYLEPSAAPAMVNAAVLSSRRAIPA